MAVPLHELGRDLDRNELINVASALIAMPTFDKGERTAIGHAQEFLERRGVTTRLLSRDPSRPNLVATIGTGRPIVALNGHVDTVPIGDRAGWETDPLTPTLKGERLYGLGAIDMKAPLAVLLMVAAAMQRVADRMRGAIQLQITVDEETTGYDGSIFLIEQIRQGGLDRPDFVISGERTDLTVSNAERGGFKFEVEFMGRAAHTADARTKGINPILHAARGIAALERPLDEFHPNAGYGIISVNVVRGGDFISQVPDRCLIQVDRRMVPGQTNVSALAQAEADLREALKDVPNAKYEIRSLRDKRGRERYYAPNLTDWHSRVVQSVVKAHEAVTGKAAQPCVGAFGATDGRLFRYEGIETVVYGPSGEGAHGANEYVDVDSLVTQFNVLTAALADLLSVRP
ncbi:MAG: hypothetical protein A2W26_11330 [Acidobacteria bacterium RBG_16_64_8]|nr:MAG: hypothetical protein A2W26_11330 [Acidobacteria bacterium RBG_16_64_8]